MCSCVLLPFSPENLENSGILAFEDLGQCQTSDYMTFGMIAPLWLH
jgi:hypothetical protein